MSRAQSPLSLRAPRSIPRSTPGNPRGSASRRPRRAVRHLPVVALLAVGLAMVGCEVDGKKNLAQTSGGADTAATATKAVVKHDEHVNTDKTGLAIHGYDPVAYFTQGKAVPGDFMVTATHGGATYRFASKANRDRFNANPGKYLPQYGGYCAYGVALGKKFSADPNVFRVEDDKLYLNLNPDIAKAFNKDVAGNISKANKNWPGIKDVPAGEIK